MNAQAWQELSTWHNAWLAADPAERAALRTRLAAQQPELVSHADELVAASAALDGFLETPAFVLAAPHLAEGERPLVPGTIVGPYAIASLLARGGMGDVYRATDLRLRRDVALKVLAGAGASDGYRVERFLQEARLTAALDDPNIVKVYDVGVVDHRPYLVAELLDGQTLRERIGSAPMSPAEAAGIATEIARGLVAAHAAGLVHRDLKPENIFLTRSGVTKILDFGIAKLVQDEAVRERASTMTGVLLGTAGYLAPEQIRGEAVDGRADLFALGSMLFEMLTGVRAFAREHTIDTLHAIMHDPPPDLVADRRDISAPLGMILRRLLEKAPADRFQSASDLVWALEHAAAVPGEPAVSAALRPAQLNSVRRRRSWSRWWLGAAAAAVITALGLASWSRWSAGQSPVAQPSSALTRFTWSLPDRTSLVSAPVVSPDGSRIVFVGVQPPTPRLYIRARAASEATVIVGSEGAKQPFWSPDGQSIGFFARGKLMKVAIDGGAPVALADAPDGRGGAWSPSGIIVFLPDYRDTGLLRVSADGGPVAPATLLDSSQDELAHRWPVFLPDGVHFIYFVGSSIDERRGVYVSRIDRPAAVPAARLIASESEALFVPTPGSPIGHLLSVVEGHIEARSFDVARLRVVGDARRIGEAAGATAHHPMLLSASADMLASAATIVPFEARLAVIDRDGTNLRVDPVPQMLGWPRVSPDGRRLALMRLDWRRTNPDIWVQDLERGARTRITSTSDLDVMPVWSPDGLWLAHRSGKKEAPFISVTAADGTGVPRRLECPRLPCEATDWSPDGANLIVNVGGGSGDVWLVPVAGDAAARPLLAEPFTERDARVSSDGRWIAYASNESGVFEVSVRSLSGPPQRVVVSSGGGDQPVWRRDGAELLFVNPEGRLHAVSARVQNGRFLPGAAVRLTVPPLGPRHWGTIYDVSPDGKRIHLTQATGERAPREINVVLGWRALLFH
jgi:serine/threonine protein kinase/Tol biopolymer transport system component